MSTSHRKQADPQPVEALGAAPKAAGVRSRVRVELTNEILSTARHHLAAFGAPGLSLRAVARDVGMVSSAIYRYFPSRDDLLTALIIEAYEHLADAIEGAEQSVSRADYRGRWLASGRGLRRWAVAHPHEWGLIYGTPVPGYRAPEATVAPVVRAANVVMDIQRDQFADASAFAPTTAQPMNDEVRAAIAPLLATFPDANSDALALGFASWVGLIGLVSFELFGHMHNVVNDAAKFYDHELNRLADQLALGS